MHIKRFMAMASVAVVALLALVGAAGADTYATGFEPPDFSTTFDNSGTQPAGSVNAQNGWHSAIPGDIPALPNGYDQSIVNNAYPGFPSDFGTQALRVSNAVSEVTGEFEYQTYSPSVANPAGETQTNKVFDGSFEFFDPSYQPGLRVSISPDNGHGGRMSYLDLKDTASGVQATFYDVAADGTFQAYDAGLYSHGAVHTVEFKIQVVPGPANDVLRLIIDDKDIGDSLGVCFTTWEQYYRVDEGHEPGVIDSFEFRSTNTSGGGYGTCDLNGAVGSPDPVTGPTCTVTGLVGGGYLFDNVSTDTRNTDPPAPTVCSQVGKILPTATTCQMYRDGTAPPALDQLQYTTKGSKINAVSPGVFFYYTKVSGAKSDSVGITETNNGVPLAASIPIQQGQVVLYDASTCTKLKWTVTEHDSLGTATGTLPSSGNFIIGTKYSPSSLKGQAVPNPTSVTYTFGTTLNSSPIAVDTASIDLVPKPVGP